jgi:hypothetical protein
MHFFIKVFFIIIIRWNWFSDVKMRKRRRLEVVDLELEEQNRFQLAKEGATCLLCGQSKTKVP